MRGGTDYDWRLTAENWQNLLAIWDHVLHERLCVAAWEHPIVLAEPMLISTENRAAAAGIIFDSLGAPALYMAPHAVLALHGAGRTTGLVLESGDAATWVVPVYEGHALSHVR